MEEKEARNAILLFMVLFKNVHMTNCRSETKSIFGMFLLKSPVFVAGVALAFLAHVLSMYLPWGQKILRTQPVSASYVGADLFPRCHHSRRDRTAQMVVE